MGATLKPGVLRIRMVVQEHDAQRSLEVLSRTLRALMELDGARADGETTVRWTFLCASLASPLTVEWAPSREQERADAARLASTFVRGIRALGHRALVPPGWNEPALRSIRAVTPESGPVPWLRFDSANEEEAVLDVEVVRAIDTLLGVDPGAHRQWLRHSGELRDIITNEWKFTIFPSGGARRVFCSFRPENLEAVKALLRKRVWVYGRARVSPRAEQTTIEVEEFGELPDTRELPTFRDLKPVDLAGGVDSTEFVRGGRDE